MLIHEGYLSFWFRLGNFTLAVIVQKPSSVSIPDAMVDDCRAQLGSAKEIHLGWCLPFERSRHGHHIFSLKISVTETSKFILKWEQNMKAISLQCLLYCVYIYAITVVKFLFWYIVQICTSDFPKSYEIRPLFKPIKCNLLTFICIQVPLVNLLFV